MSSSMFIESSSLPPDSKDYASTSDSNLVVVYGKNGVNFDDKGLENVIEEKKIASISVIRLTSPTPSMKEEEEEDVKLEEMMRRQGLDSEESSGVDDNSTDCDRYGTADNDDSSDGDENEDQHSRVSDDKQYEESKSKNKIQPRRRGRQPNAIKHKKLTRKRKRDRPEIVGLRFEEFYPPDDAGAIIKEALKMAGLGPDRKSKEDYEFQLLVIKNDHCYTPFTSPSQMKAKLAADKLELEKQSNMRKIVSLQTTTGKQLFVRKKAIQKEILAKFENSPSSTKDKSIISVINRGKKDIKDIKSQSESVRGEDEIRISSTDEYDDSKIGAGDEESDGSSAKESDESDNDRDSDLDFDVNNPKGRRRKIKLGKSSKRTAGTPKTQQKSRRIHCQEDQTELATKPNVNMSTATVNRQKLVLKNVSDTGRITIRSTTTKLLQAGGCTTAGGSGAQTVLSPTISTLPPIPRKQIESKLVTTPAATNVAYKSMVLNNVSETRPLPVHKEILINRQVMSSPKTKGFTDLNVLMDQREQEKAVTPVTKIVIPKSSNVSTTIITPKHITPLKGFMPLGMETAAKNQLPAQISIQTHQSCSELEAEHDKQLDLINSIVQDELKKSHEILTPAPNIIENIPDLVKMLESTEKVLESTISSQKSEFTADKIKDICKDNNALIGDNIQSGNNNSSIADIDISNDSLLATPDEEEGLPDDILQQVVDLIKDHKTLQEAVEVLGTGDCSDPINNTGDCSVPINNTGDCSDPINNTSCITSLNPPPLAPISQQVNNKNILEDIPHSSKSIIQMSISNVSPAATPRSTVIPNRIITNQVIKTSNMVRKEPIQIVRGNGRVITLPPIEAPTTRAKRRAQAQPSSILNVPISSAYSSGGLSNVSEASLDNSMHSSSSIVSVGGTISVAQEKRIQDSTNRRRGSKENITVTATVGNQKTKRTTGNKKASRPQIAADASNSGDEDDDDPNKLWCLCRQPHNNRFMICCDACEDWFHGTCVNITKAMGLEMEQNGVDWTCPKCLKKLEEKKQPKITDLLTKKTVATTIVQVSENLPTSPIVTADTTLHTTMSVAPNVEQETKIQSKETITENPKAKIECGQFIQIKNNKVFLQTASPGTVGSNKIIVQSIRTTPNPNQGSFRIALPKNIKFIKTISPAQSTTQNVIASNISNATAVNEYASCIVCKKIARPNSIYCSDDCIRKYAQNAWNAFSTKSQTDMSSPGSPFNKNTQDDKAKKKAKGLFEDVLLLADHKPKMERANVFERKSGRILTGSSAPTFPNLKKWLQDNPTFEVIQPGSVQAMDIERKHKLRVQQTSSPSVLKTTTSPPPLKLFPSSSSVQQKTEMGSSSPQTQSSIFQKHTLTPKPNRITPDIIKSSPTSTYPRPGTPKQLQKYPQHVGIKADKIQKSYEDNKSIKDIQASSKRPNTTETNKTTGSDGDIRLVVRRTLKEHLLIRIQNGGNGGNASTANISCESDTTKLSDVPKLTTEEIEEFAKVTELEMYNYFNRDTGSKYKAKYRSLVFNIKDRKNQTLFAKICGKLIDPKQLVRMSPEEMASQELAQWREQEAKHQLEIIKKSELDLLACAKNYVLKTHKGEEVIEGKSSEYGNVDIIIPVEDMSALTKTDFAEEVTTAKSQTHRPDVDSTSLSQSIISETLLQSEKVTDEEKFKTSNVHNKEKDRERNKEKDKHRDRERDCEKRQKSKDRYRDKSRSRKRSRSHSRSRSRERNEKRHKSSHKEEKREKEKDRIKDRLARDQHLDSNDKKYSIERKTPNTSKRDHVAVKKQSQDYPLETYNLVDQIIESRKTVEEAANLVSERNKDKTSLTTLSTQSITSSTATCSSDSSTVIDIPAPSSCVVESDQEPTSTVSIPTPPHDPYSRFTSPDYLSFDCNDSNRCSDSTFWTGNINMVDVTSFHLCLQSVLGNYIGLSKLLANELDVVGRIGPETVWDYISKIKKSPNKEIVVIRLLPASETETAAYKLLYEYLDHRNRQGVIKSVSPFIKDFYIFPLSAGKLMPIVLHPSEPVEFYDDPYRPDMLIGIIIRVVGKRQNALQSISLVNDSSHKLSNRTIDVDSYTPPGSPKLKKRRHSVVPKDIDVDAIIKAPIVSKSNKAMSTTIPISTLTDADEPYSPGGSSDDDLPLLPIKLSGGSNQIQTAEEELKRKMEEINRQIAAQEMEIAGLLTGESTKFGTPSSTTSKVLANIAIPSNLSQILASIKPSVSAEVQPAVPPPPPLIGSLINVPSTETSANEEYNPAEPIDSPYKTKNTTSSSRLATLSEAELLSMVPDDIVITPKPSVRYEEPPPPGV